MEFSSDPFSINEPSGQGILDFLPYPFLLAKIEDGRIFNSYVNNKFIEEIGYTTAEIPTLADWFNKAYPDKEYRSHVEGKWLDMLQKAKSENRDSVWMEAKIHTKKYGDRWYEVKASITQASFQMVAFVDIHDSKLQAANLRNLNENRDRILSILGHDLRSPLMHLYSLSKMALTGQISNEDFIKLISEINVKAFQGMEFLSTTLSWAKSNFNVIKVKYEEITLKPLLEEILLLYASMYSAKRMQINVAVNPSFKILSDKEILTTVLRNLISNAIKFTHVGGTISLMAEQNEKQTLIIVEDDGMGIEHEKRDQIDANDYSSGIGTYGEKGLGIGLMLCKDLLQRMNSSLVIESTAGLGTTVRIIMPTLIELKDQVVISKVENSSL